MKKYSLTADGQTAAKDHSGGHVFIAASGTFGGGTLTLQMSPDAGTTWIATDVSLTDAGFSSIRMAQGTQVRVDLAGATTPDITVWLG